MNKYCKRIIQSACLYLLAGILVSINTYAQTYRNEWIDYNKTYFKFKIGPFGNDPITGTPIRKGLVRIPQTTLAAAGLSAASAEHFQLWRDGQEVPIYTSVPTGVMSNADYIEFWAEINNGILDKDLYKNSSDQLADYWSLLTDTASYFLTINTTSANKRLTPENNLVSGTQLTPLRSFQHTLSRPFRNEFRLGFAATSQSLYASTYDVGEAYSSRRIRPNGTNCNGTTGQTQFPLQFSDLAGNLRPDTLGGNFTLRVFAFGNANNARQVLIKMNDDANGLTEDSIGVFQMDYFTQYKYVRTDLPISRIKNGGARVVTINRSANACDDIRLNLLEITYPRLFNFNNATKFDFNIQNPNAADSVLLKIASFNHGGNAPVLYDLINGKRYLGDISIADTVQFVLLPAATYQLVLTRNDAGHYTTVNQLESKTFTNYNTASNQGDFLIISNPLIYGNTGSTDYVEQYKQYKSSAAGGGFNAKVIDADELADQFAWGIKKHPLGIKNFLRYARDQFSTAPKFVFIIGKGVVYNEWRANESNANALKLNLVPTWGSPGSDNLLVSDNQTGVPAIPIGRLSAVSVDEVGDYLKKVKAFDSTRNQTAASLEDRSWMKNVMMIAGANDISQGELYDSYFAKYKATIQDTAFGGKVITFSKTASPATYSDDLLTFKSIYEKGSSIVTYFGHSTASTLDFNLDNPNAYNNQNRYPLFLVNGCNAGNFFTFETNRLSIQNTISEKFVLAKDRGAIGYIASTNLGVINYLDSFTNKVFKAISTEQYNAGIGEVLKTALQQTVSGIDPDDFFGQMHAQQLTLHGDPSLKIAPFDKPDYAVNAQSVQITPQFLTPALDSFSAKVLLHNLGKFVKDSVSLKIVRKFPNNTLKTVFQQKIKSINHTDSITINLPINGLKDIGNGELQVSIDETNSVDELNESNNTVQFPLTVSEDAIIPTYPFNYAIVNQPPTQLLAQTVNPFATSKQYKVEVDTTTLFNSPIKQSQVVAAVGGIVSFNPSITYQDGITYYWRVAVNGIAQPHWNQFSFTYKNQPNKGLGQQHFYQHTQSVFDRLLLDSLTRKTIFRNKKNNLFIIHSIFPTSGTEDAQFSVAVNGNRTIQSACAGFSLIFNVFDTLTFKPWVNKTNPYGAAAVCSPDSLKKYNFEYQDINLAGRNGAKNFFDSIPNGMYVVVRKIYEAGSGANVFADVWKGDEFYNGAGNTMYHRLLSQGLPVDSFNAPRTFGFIFKKNDSATFKPTYQFSAGLNDRIILSADMYTKDTLGFIESPVFGKAKQWKKIKWNGTSSDSNDKVLLNVIGVQKNGTKQTLYQLNSTQQDIDISSIDAQTYPSIQLKLTNQDSITASPYQLQKWSVEYDEAPEGALAPNLFFNFPDTVKVAGLSGGFNQISDSLKGGIAFKNIGTVAMDSLSVQLILTNDRDSSFTFNLGKIKPLNPGDTVNIHFAAKISHLTTGNYNAYFIVNPNAEKLEQYSFNNSFIRQVYLLTNIVLPSNLLSFVATANGKQVDLNWQANNEINLKSYQVEFSVDGRIFKTIGEVSYKGNAALNNYSFKHYQPSNGKNYYRLKMIDKDGTYYYSVVRIVELNEDGKTAILVYPNPVVDKLSAFVKGNPNQSQTIKITNLSGQVLLQQSFNGVIDVDMKPYAAGIYMVQIWNGAEVKLFRIQKK